MIDWKAESVLFGLCVVTGIKAPKAPKTRLLEALFKPLLSEIDWGGVSNLKIFLGLKNNFC